MTRLNYQFHATPQELLFELLPNWLQGCQVFLAAEDFSREPKRFFVEGSDLRAAAAELGTIYRVLVRLAPFENRTATRREFFDSNPNFLAVSPGRLSFDGLTESIVGADVAEQISLTAWRRVISRAKMTMNTGAIVVGPSGARAEEKSHPFTGGAYALYLQGVPMLGVAGSTRYEFKDS